VTETRERLARCFSSVFPNLTAEQILEANVVTLGELDSWASVTLLSVIDEEFGVSLEPEQLWELGTFPAIEEYLAKQDVGIQEDRRELS
jgi:acyl carrier protein